MGLPHTASQPQPQPHSYCKFGGGQGTRRIWAILDVHKVMVDLNCLLENDFQLQSQPKTWKLFNSYHMGLPHNLSSSSLQVWWGQKKCRIRAIQMCLTWWWRQIVSMSVPTFWGFISKFKANLKLVEFSSPLTMGLPYTACRAQAHCTFGGGKG